MMRLCAIIGITLLSGACSTVANAENEPAVLINPSANTQAELKDVVSKALGGRTVRLAADSLTKENRLIIDKATHMRGGNPIMGRKIEKPDHFYLMMSGTDCLLRHEQSGEIYKLRTTECQTIPRTLP